jgi:hypothetical protein
VNDEGPWTGLPGADLIEEGLADLRTKRTTEYALLVLVGKPRLRALAIEFPDYRPPFNGPVEHALYEFLEQKYEREAYSRYNSLLRRMNSFAHALEREQSKRDAVAHQT